jgi:tetratricopeptide (TPR) repeat protein
MGIFNWLNKKAKNRNKARSSKNFESFQDFEAEVSLDKSFIENLPKSNVKFDDLDDKTKSEIEDKTIFVNDDGTIDQSKGAGKSLVERMNFFSTEIKGINIENIKWDFNNDNIPSNDIDGAWHFVNRYYLMKCISKDKLNNELDCLLEDNKILKSSASKRFDFGSSVSPTLIYEGDEFTIEIPPVTGEYYTIVIFQNEKNKSNLSENDLEPGLVNEAFLKANEFQSQENHIEAIKIYNSIIEFIKKLNLGELENDDFNGVEIKDNLLIEKITDKIENHIPIDGIYFNLGQSYRAFGSLDWAQEAYENAIKANKNTEAMVFHHLGVTNFQLGNLESCIKNYTNALKKDSGFYNSYYMRAAAYLDDRNKLQDVKLAKKDLMTFLHYCPEDKSGIRLLETINSIESNFETKNSPKSSNQSLEEYKEIKNSIDNDKFDKQVFNEYLEKVTDWVNNYESNTFENSLAEIIFLKVQLQLVLEEPIGPIMSDVQELIKNHQSFVPKEGDLGSSLYETVVEMFDNS